MKITKESLKQIIKEEIDGVLSEAKTPRLFVGPSGNVEIQNCTSDDSGNWDLPPHWFRGSKNKHLLGKWIMSKLSDGKPFGKVAAGVMQKELKNSSGLDLEKLASARVVR